MIVHKEHSKDNNRNKCMRVVTVLQTNIRMLVKLACDHWFLDNHARVAQGGTRANQCVAFGANFKQQSIAIEYVDKWRQSP